MEGIIHSPTFISSSGKQDSRADEADGEASTALRDQQDFDEEKHISDNNASQETNVLATKLNRNIKPPLRNGPRSLITLWAALFIMNVSYIYIGEELSRPLQILAQFVCSSFPLISAIILHS